MIFSGNKIQKHVPEPKWDIHIALLKNDEKKFLFSKISKIKKGGIYVEIGTYKGGSAVLAAASNPNIKVYAVDIWKELNPDFSVFKRNTQFFKNIIPIKVDPNFLEGGSELIAQFEKVPLNKLKIDFLFIDGFHSAKAVKKDLEIYEKYSNFICGHDFLYQGYVNIGLISHYSKLGFISNKFMSIAFRFFLKLFKFKLRKIKLSGGNSSIWYKE